MEAVEEGEEEVEEVGDAPEVEPEVEAVVLGLGLVVLLLNSLLGTTN